MSSLSPSIGQVLGYQLIEEIGAGGMGLVYRAHDDRLDRDVALKVLPAQALSDDAVRKRFRKEALTLSKLSHPHIATIHDFDTYGGIDFLVMELVSGATLAQTVVGGALPEEKVITLGIQIAQTLQDAHEEGIVHRDLKPGNIMLTPRDQIKLLDFGLAKLLAPGKATTAETLSEIHDAGGTMPYMAPEQLQGGKPDPRSDIYSLGVVLYEMASGVRPFEAKTSAALIDAILHKPAPSPRQVNRGLSLGLEYVILKCLEKEPDYRYQSAREVVVDLRRLASSTAVAPMRARKLRVSSAAVFSAIAALLVIMTVVIGWRLVKGKAQTERVPSLSRMTIAVLPFQNAAHDANLDYLGTALPDEVITTLSYAPMLSVRPFSMSQRFTNQNLDPHQTGKQLQVSNVVAGHYLRRSDRLTVTLEAMDVGRDEIVWRGSVEVGMNDVLGLREEVSRALQRGLLPSLGASGTELSATKPKSQEAYRLYLHSQDSSYWSVAHNKDGIALLERSLALDPGYAPAWLALGAHYYNEADMVTGNQETFVKCIAAFERAHQLDPNLLSASTWLIGTRRVYGDLAVSFMQVQELAQKRPRRAEVHLLLAQLLRSAGALEQAAHECEITHQLDAELWTDCFVLYIYMGDFAKARQEIDRSSGEF